MRKVQNNIEAVNTLISAGRSIISVDSNKQPTGKWKQFQKRIPEPDELQYTKHIALVCGEVSGNVEGLDIDLKHATNPELVFKQFKKRVDEELPGLWETFTIQKTVSGGYHLIYRCKTIEGNQVLAKTKKGKPIFETRGEGGYVVIAPSPGYKLQQNDLEQISKIHPEDREALHEICRSFDNSVNANRHKGKTNTIEPVQVDTIRKDVEIVLNRIEEKQKDITEGYENWRNIAFALADTFDEDGLDYFDRVSQFHPGYDKRNCEKQFQKCLHHKPTGELVTIRTFFDLAIQHGIKVPKQKINFRKTLPGSLFIETNRTPVEPPKRLFGPLWAQGELAFLFGEDGTGKSILAVQIARAIAEGKKVKGFENEVKQQKVALFDAELSDAQFNSRYKEDLPKNFKRFQINGDKVAELVKISVENVVDEIEQTAEQFGAKIIILDNLSALTAMIDGTQTNESIQLMGLLNSLKRKGFSILVIDHCRKPQKEGEYKAISKHDLQGSKMKTNLADSVFSIGMSCQGDNVRYIKGIKIRSFEMAFTKNEVAEMKLRTDPLRLQYEGFGPEYEHVNDKTAKMYKMAAEGKSQIEIAEALNVSQPYISKILSRV